MGKREEGRDDAVRRRDENGVSTRKIWVWR